LAQVSTGSVAVSAKKTHQQTGISPRYAAPEMFSKTRNAVFSDQPVLFLDFILFHFEMKIEK